MSGMTGPTPPSRRELNKADKRQRILDAATRLFTERGYAAATSQEIATDAGVAVGTVFRYAATKPELLLMVINERLAARAQVALERARRAPSITDAVLELMRPAFDLVEQEPQNAIAYLREVLFGEPGLNRDAALGWYGEMATQTRDLLEASQAARPDVDLLEVAYLFNSALLVELSALAVGWQDEDPREAMSRHVDVLLHGVLRPERTLFEAAE